MDETGAFLFVDKGEARIDVVPVKSFDLEGLSEVGIAENEKSVGTVKRNLPETVKKVCPTRKNVP